jgi:trimethylguanosine synthase
MQRYSIFSLYDSGIQLTDSAWFEVTPEPIAASIAKHVALASPPGKKILIDAFGGVGGNVIQFALSGRWERIFAVEKDKVKVQCARNNAEVYGVGKKVFWITGDVFEALGKRLKSLGQEAVIFASPPWGGMSSSY